MNLLMLLAALLALAAGRVRAQASKDLQAREMEVLQLRESGQSVKTHAKS